MVPGVGLHGRAADFSSAFVCDPEECFLDDDYADEDDQSERGGSGAVRRADEDFAKAIDGNEQARHEKKKRPGDRSEGFHFSVAVGVVGVRRAFGVFQCGPDEARAENIERGFQSIGKEGV